MVSKPRCGVRVSQLDPAMVSEVTGLRAATRSLALPMRSHVFARPISMRRARRSRGEASDQIAGCGSGETGASIRHQAPCAMPRLMASINDLHRSDARFLFATWKQLAWQPRSDTETLGDPCAVTRRDGEGAGHCSKRTCARQDAR